MRSEGSVKVMALILVTLTFVFAKQPKKELPKLPAQVVDESFDAMDVNATGL